jgi:hypothetical protein
MRDIGLKFCCRIWLGFGYGNITFQDSLDFDLSEIESVYDNNDGEQ